MAWWRLPWPVLGVASAGCGILGIVLPMRSSPRSQAWLIGHPRLGPPIRDWRAHGAISR